MGHTGGECMRVHEIVAEFQTVQWTLRFILYNTAEIDQTVKQNVSWLEEVRS